MQQICVTRSFMVALTMIKKHKVRYVFATLIIIIALQHMFCMPNRGFVAKNF